MIVFEHVDKIYPNGYKALNDINLKINDGDFVCIIGLSGAGKSTLIRTINKMHDIQKGKLTVDMFKTVNSKNYKATLSENKYFLKKFKKDSDHSNYDELVEINNYLISHKDDFIKDPNFTYKFKRLYDLTTLNGKNLRLERRNIGMIFQSFNLVNRSNAYTNVLSGRVGYHNFFEILFNIYTKEEKVLALQSLEKLGILDKAFIRCDQLSGGQMQRVALARALTQEPAIILADEPVASLDPVTTISVMNDFRRINQNEKITIVANMHHVDLALKYATRIIGIKEGHIVFDGLPKDINDEILLKIYGRSLNSNEKLGDVDEKDTK
jgi:phosphonate transport system ATP-binding protein